MSDVSQSDRVKTIWAEMLSDSYLTNTITEDIESPEFRTKLLTRAMFDVVVKTGGEMRRAQRAVQAVQEKAKELKAKETSDYIRLFSNSSANKEYGDSEDPHVLERINKEVRANGKKNFSPNAQMCSTPRTAVVLETQAVVGETNECEMSDYTNWTEERKAEYDAYKNADPPHESQFS